MSEIVFELDRVGLTVKPHVTAKRRGARSFGHFHESIVKNSVGGDYGIAVFVASRIEQVSQTSKVIGVAVSDHNGTAMKGLGSQHVGERDVYISSHVFLFTAVDEYDLTIRSLDHRPITLADVDKPHLKH